MVQQINVSLNSFANPMRLPLLCKNSRAIHLVQLCLMAGRQAGRQNINFKFLKFATDQNF